VAILFVELIYLERCRNVSNFHKSLTEFQWGCFRHRSASAATHAQTTSTPDVSPSTGSQVRVTRLPTLHLVLQNHIRILRFHYTRKYRVTKNAFLNKKIYEPSNSGQIYKVIITIVIIIIIIIINIKDWTV
jgi:hypothetical protein